MSEATAGRRGRWSSRRRFHLSHLVAAAAFLLPALVALFVTRLVPAGSIVVQSLQRTTILNPTPRFIGFENYGDLFGDSSFWGSVKVTVLFSLILNPLIIFVAFMVALLYIRATRWSGFFRALVIIPVTIPAATAAIIWGVIYQPKGPANALLKALGLPTQQFLASQSQALMSIIVMIGWIGAGFWMLFLIAAINEIPEEIYEAAALDGAGAWRKHLSITVPLVRSQLLFMLVAATGVHLVLFAPVQILTSGGPSGSTNLLMYEIYQRAYTLRDPTHAAAEVVVLVLLALGIITLQFRFMKGRH
ncbi:MAG: sugar ABC transporter permease [Microbacterium sp.]